MTTWFTADPHFGHLLTTRPFKSVEAQNDVLISEINLAVPEGDRLIVLGDFAWHAAESWLNHIKCRNKHLIYGNHDRASAGRFFKTAVDVAELKIQGHKIWLSHYPHAYWPASHYGSLHLYGHCHRQREATLDACFPGRRSMDVSVDNAYKILGRWRPFSEDEIISILASRPGHDDIEFYRRLQGTYE